MQFVVLKNTNSDKRPIEQLRCSISAVPFKKMGFIAGDPVLISSSDGRKSVGVAWPSVKPSLNGVVLGSSIDLFKSGEMVFVEKIEGENEVLYGKVNVLGRSSLDVRILIKDLLSNVKFVSKRFKLIIRNEIFYFECDSLSGSSSQYGALKDDFKLIFSSESKKKFSFNEIGGLSKEIEAIKNLIEIPLNHADLIQVYGLRMPRGILLYGPPGTGKTLIARSVANCFDVFFKTVNAAEIATESYGGSEANLRTIFEEATLNAPSIIFFDEVDALCPKRDDSSNDADKRVVSTLLTLMDGMSTEISKPVIILAATNRPNALDPALRRPGRFDKEIEIGVPSADDRLDILQKLLINSPHEITDEELKSLSQMSHGFVGADLSLLVSQAASLALRETLAEPESSNLEDILEEKLNLSNHKRHRKIRKISFSHLLIAFKSVRPSGLRELLVEVPKVRWDQVGGQERVKQLLIEAVEFPLKSPEKFRKFGLGMPKGILLYGPPGCSKTMMARALATESGLNFILVKGPELLNKYVGESERMLRELFRKARAASPSIVFFDEIDAFASSRDHEDLVSNRLVSQLLNELDGLEALLNVVVLAATNRPQVLDSALMRPGRFDRLIHVPLPDLNGRKEILKISLLDKLVSKLIDIEAFAGRTDGYTGAELVALCSEAAFSALRRDAEEIEMCDLEEALETVKPRLSNEEISLFKNFCQA